MKRQFLKEKNNRLFYFGLIIISLVYLFLRLWKFQTLFTFHLDQGIHLSEAWEMITSGRPRLVGPMVITKIYDGRGFFIGANYYYLLAIMGLIAGWQPVLISIFSLLIEFFFIFFFAIWLRKRAGAIPVLICFSLIALANYLVIHSRFFWNPHFLIPIGILLLVFLERFWRKAKLLDFFLIGFFWGNGISFHYSASLWALPIIGVLILKRKNWKRFFLFLLPLGAGVVLGNLPLILFELRHNFYNLKTMIFVFSHLKEPGLVAPYFFVFSGFAFIFYFSCLFLKKLFDQQRKLAIFVSLASLAFFLLSVDLKKQWPEGMPEGWNWLVQDKVMDLIIGDGCPSDFNIASTLSGDTRSYDLRFLLERKGCPAMEVDQYPENKRLFLIADIARPPEKEKVWEVDSLRPFVISREIILNDYAKFYQLDRIGY